MKPKICKGTSQAKGFGCGQPNPQSSSFHKGLCNKCWPKWLYSTEAGKQYVEKITAKAKKITARNQAKEIREQKKAIKKSNPKRDFYKSMAWLYCSRYVLLYYSVDGMVQCSTSPHRWYPLNDRRIHCGHYIKVDQFKATAFEFKNLAPQSYTDNIMFSGKPEIMAEWLKKQHGNDVIEWLNIQKHKICHLSKSEYEYWAEHYKKLFCELVKEKGINPWNQPEERKDTPGGFVWKYAI